MATPFVPVPIQVRRTTSGGCMSRPRRTSPSGSPSSSSSGSSPPGRTPWIRGAGSWGKTVARPPSLPQPGSSPEGCGRRTRGAAEGSSSPVQEDGCPPGRSWVKRPITPTLLGYEIMEERAKFTVYKILVTGLQGDTWVIFRRYTDFSRLNDKLKEIFPRFRLALPPKRWFKDNYDMEFLEERQIGLQIFLQNLLAHKDIINSEVVRQFLCLDEPPGPFDSLVESRAFCETLEETNHRLQTELLERQKEIVDLQIALEERESRIALLEERVNGVSLNPESSRSPCRLSAEGSESSGCTDPETDRHRDTEADRHRDTEADEHRDTEADRHRDTEADGHRDTEADEHKVTEADGHRDTEADRHKVTEADGHRDTEADGHRDTETDEHRDTETDTNTNGQRDTDKKEEADAEQRSSITEVEQEPDERREAPGSEKGYGAYWNNLAISGSPIPL